jgi:hypothetical protein
LGAGTGTVRQAAADGEVPPDAAGLVAELVAEAAAGVLGLVLLVLPLLPQPATTRRMATDRHALRTEE